MKGLIGKVSLVLLNPPFSCRGGTLWKCSLNGETIRCGLALAFLITAIPYLKSDGEIITILPKGCLTNEKDRQAIEALTSLGHWSILGTNAHDLFAGCSAHTAIARLKLCGSCLKPKMCASLVNYNPTEILFSVRICRGRLSMHLLNNYASLEGIAFVHSTELHADEIVYNSRRVKADVFHITGPAVLLPRVGRPNKFKIHTYESNAPLALSDCIIALRCESNRDAYNVRDLLLANWSILEERFCGTCAQHITLKALTELLASLGVKVIN